jgi:hypothetical protein
MCLKLSFGWQFASPVYPPQAAADWLGELAKQLARAHELLPQYENTLARVSKGIIELHIDSRDGCRLDEYLESAHHAALVVAELVLVSMYRLLALPVPRACLWKFPRDAKGLLYAEELVVPAATNVAARHKRLEKQWQGLGLTKELFDRLWAGIRLESQAAGVLAPASIANLHIEGKTVYVGGVPVPLNLTPERTADALAFLGELLREPGNWKSSSDIGRETQLEGVRFDRLFRALPGPVKSEIESVRRKGYRVRLA